MRPKIDVSIGVIFRDEEVFLNEAIASVHAQTLRSWELLLADDGSVDGSTALACRYAEQDPRRIRYLEHAGHGNRGMRSSRDLGISSAAGELLAFLDADDVLRPVAIKQQVAVLRAAIPNPTKVLVRRSRTKEASSSARASRAGSSTISPSRTLSVRSSWPRSGDSSSNAKDPVLAPLVRGIRRARS